MAADIGLARLRAPWCPRGELHAILPSGNIAVPASDGVLPLKCDRGLRWRLIVQALLTEVFQGRLEAGQHLVTQVLADRFGVSHTPIREALIALAGIGIVDLAPNRGAVVRLVTPQNVREFCRVRRALECEAVRSACGRIDLVELAALADEFQKLADETSSPADALLDRAAEVDNRLHDLVAASCGNGFLVHELNRLKLLFRAFRDVSYHRDSVRFVSSRLNDETHEHLAIVEALRVGDRKAAGLAMGRHILSAVEHWTRTLPSGAPRQAGPDVDRVDKPNGRRTSPRP